MSRMSTEADLASISSPSKKGFFRDRKASTASKSSVAGPSMSRPTGSSGGVHSPAGRGHGWSNYGLFSKSQGDLNGRPDTGSPADTPKLPAMPLQMPLASPTEEGGSFLRSPSPHGGHDDTGRSSSPQPGWLGSSPNVGSSSSNAGLRSEQGSGPNSWGRASDLGAMSLQPMSYATGNARPRSPLSGSRTVDAALESNSWGRNGAGFDGRTPSPDPTAARKGYRQPLTEGIYNPREKKSSNTLVSSFSLTNVAAGASNVIDRMRGPSSNATDRGDSSEPAALPPGAIYQGLLNRNTNVSLPLSQMGSMGPREKDVTKAWKAYKVVLKDGAIHFYKPPNSVQEDVKHLFPTTMARAAPGSAAGLDGSPRPFDADMLKQSGLGTKDLLRATGPGSSAGLPLRGLPPTSPAKLASVPPTPVSALASAVSVPLLSAPLDKWHRPGAHADLRLVSSIECPSSWAERLESGSLDALVHEFIFATQSLPTDSPQDAATVVQAVLVVLLRSGGNIRTFLSKLLDEASPALDIQVGNSLNGRSIQTNEELETFTSGLQARLGWCFDILIAHHAKDLDLESVTVLESLARKNGNLDLDIAAAIQEQHSGVAASTLATDWGKYVADVARPKLASLATGHFSISDLLSFEPVDVARQIQVFHADRLRAIAVPRLWISRLVKTGDSFSVPGSSPTLFSLCGSTPHWLTTLTLEHILDPQSSAKYRASVLRHWAGIGSYLLSFGDLLGWTAIATAICSRAVSRLVETWRYVGAGDQALVGTWAPALMRLGWDEDSTRPFQAAMTMEAVTARRPKAPQSQRSHCLPFLGDSLVQLDRKLALVTGQQQLKVADVAGEANRIYQACHTWFTEGCEGQLLESDFVSSVGRPIKEFQQALQTLAQRPSSRSIQAHLTASLQLEAPSLGHNGPRETPVRSSQMHAKAVRPLVFVDALPTLTLLDKASLLSAAHSPDDRTRADLHDSTLRAPGQSRYARSPLSGSPLTKPPVSSLARSKSCPTGHRGSRLVPFGGIVEWSTADRNTAEDEILYRMGPDLILKSISGPPGSLPSSPMGGNRFSQDLSRGSRPSSMISKRSSKPPSDRGSMMELLPTTVTIKAGSLKSLIDVLVLGVSDLSITLSDDNGEVPLQSSSRSTLSMDLDAYRRTFLATSRSACSPLYLLESLRKRFFAASDAAREMTEMPRCPNVSRYPTWEPCQPSSSGSVAVDRDYVGRVRTGVISALQAWVEVSVQDFLDTPSLYAALVDFVQSAKTAYARPESDKEAEHEAVVKALEDVMEQLRLDMLKANVKELTPTAQASLAKEQNTQSPASNNNIDFDRATAVELVDYLESVASVFFDKITRRDLLIVADLFEQQSGHAFGWHFSREQGGEEPQVSTMYKLLELLRPPTQDASTREPESLYQKLPASIKDACSTQTVLKAWIAIRINQPRIGLQKRVARIEKLLDVVWISRARMLNARQQDDSAGASISAKMPFQEPTIGSYVENVVLSSLAASESRLFVRAWQEVCNTRGATGEQLIDLIPPKETTPSLESAVQAENATTDIGWLLRCLAQAVSRKTGLQRGSEGPLVDFEQSQIVCSLIESSMAGRTDSATDPTSAAQAARRMAAMQTELRQALWDRRLFKQDAAQEAASNPISSTTGSLKMSYRAYKPLQKVVAEQNDKQMRDRAAYDSLRNAAAEDAARVNAARSPTMGATQLLGRNNQDALLNTGSVPAAEKRSRRVTALFRGAVRQTGLMGSGSASASTSAGTDKAFDQQQSSPRSLSELLPSIPTHKPVSSISLRGARVAIWQNSQRPCLFHVSSADGQYILLQASGQAEMTDWLNEIDRAIQLASRSASFGHQGGKTAPGGPARAGVTQLYGVDIKQLVEREGRPIPLGLERMLSEVEARGLREQGIYRISGAKSAIEGLKQAFCTQPAESIDLRNGEHSDVHAIAGAIKQWYRELPEPPIPYAFYHRVIQAEGIESHDDRLYAIRDAIWEFPRPHFDLLKRTLVHLGKVVEQGEYNLMQSHNIGLVFGTFLLNPPPSATSLAEGFGQLGRAAHVVKLILTFHDWLFETEEEGAGVAEGEEAPASTDATQPASSDDVDEEDADTTINQMTSSATSTPFVEANETISAEEQGGHSVDRSFPMSSSNDSGPQGLGLIDGQGESKISGSNSMHYLEMSGTRDSSLDADRLLAQIDTDSGSDGPLAPSSSNGPGSSLPSQSSSLGLAGLSTQPSTLSSAGSAGLAAPTSGSSLTNLMSSATSSTSSLGLPDTSTAVRRGEGSETFQSRSIATAEGTRSGTIRKPREKSVYADALEIALSEGSSATRSSSLPRGGDDSGSSSSVTTALVDAVDELPSAGTTSTMMTTMTRNSVLANDEVLDMLRLMQFGEQQE